MCGSFYKFATPPSADDFAKALKTQLGTTRSFDSLTVQGALTVVTFVPGFVTEAYIDRVAHTLGGIKVGFGTKEVRQEAPLPFTARPWRTYGPIARLALRCKLWQPS